MFIINANEPPKKSLERVLKSNVISFMGAFYHDGVSISMSADTTKNPDECPHIYDHEGNIINGMLFPYEEGEMLIESASSLYPRYYEESSTQFTSNVASSVNTVILNAMTSGMLKEGTTIDAITFMRGCEMQSATIVSTARYRIVAYEMEQDGTLTTIGTSAYTTFDTSNDHLPQFARIESLAHTLSEDAYILIKLERERTKGTNTSENGPVIYGSRLASYSSQNNTLQCRIETI